MLIPSLVILSAAKDLGISAQGKLREASPSRPEVPNLRDGAGPK
jgi:hypothetical protein